MAKVLYHSFNIKLASPIKVKKQNTSFKRVGKQCRAVIIKDNNELKARLTTSPVEDSDEFLVLSLTPNSLNLKDKNFVFF